MYENVHFFMIIMINNMYMRDCEKYFSPVCYSQFLERSFEFTYFVIIVAIAVFPTGFSPFLFLTFAKGSTEKHIFRMTKRQVKKIRVK